MRSLLFIAILLIITGPCYGQFSEDSAMIKQVKAGFKLANTNPDSALTIGIKGIQQSVRSASKRLAAYSYKTRGWAWLRLGNYDSCFKDLLTSTSLFQQLNDTVETMYMYVNLADVYSAHSEFAQSALYLMKADSLAKEKNDLRVEAGIKKQMGILYREQGEYKKAVSNLKESMSLYLKTKDTAHFLDAITSLSINYNRMSLPDSSLALLKQSASLMNTVQRSTYQKAMFSEQFGDAYFALASYAKALDAYKQAYNFFASDNNYADMAYEAINVGKTFMQNKNYQEAEKYLLLSYRINDSLRLANYAGDAASQLSKLYKITHDWQKAYQWLDTQGQLMDSLNLTEQNEKNAELQAKYETEKKDKEISLLKKDQQLNLVTFQKQKAFRYGAIIVVALLVLIGFLFINRYRIVQRSKRLFEIEKLRNNIARDLHDDIGSALSSINIISKVVLENPSEKENVHVHLKKIQDNSGHMLESMSDIVWTINPVNDSFEKVIFKMKEFAADILEPMNIQYEFIQSNDLSNVKLDLNQRKNLYLIFKEAINNSAKYSNCSRVTIRILDQNGDLILEVKDNGTGFDGAGKFSGNGLKNINQRAAEMNGLISVMSEKEKGTTISLKIKSHD
jgi:two-component system sensor histidine kinase UhpB